MNIPSKYSESFLVVKTALIDVISSFHIKKNRRINNKQDIKTIQDISPKLF
jgi:hypothetical protein